MTRELTVAEARSASLEKLVDVIVIVPVAVIVVLSPAAMPVLVLKEA